MAIKQSGDERFDRMYSIKALSRMTGIPPNTLRSWERRYGIPGPVRDDMGFRLYSPEDVSFVGLIARLIAAGHSIGKLASLPREELEKLESEHAATGPDETCSLLRRRVLEAVQAKDVAKYRQLVVQTLVSCPPADACDLVISPALREVGKLWSHGKISVAVEHSFSAMTKQILFSAVNIMQWGPSKPLLAFATLPDEQHELGCLMAYFVAASRGYHCMYLGANVPTAALSELASSLGAFALVMSIVMPQNADAAAAAIRQLTADLSESSELWIGTQLALGDIGPDVLNFDSFRQYDKHLVALS